MFGSKRAMLAQFAVCAVAILAIASCGGGGGGNNSGPPPMRVVITPNSPTTKAGGQTVTFTATVQNDPNHRGVTWSFSQGTAKGTFDTVAGVYTSPAFQTIDGLKDTVSAASVADSTKSDTTQVTVSANSGSGNIGVN